MKIRDPRSLLLFLIVMALSACGDSDSDDPGTLNINEIVDDVEAINGDGGGDGSGSGSGSFSGTTIGDCTSITTIISDSTSNAELNAASCKLEDFSDNLTGQEASDGYVVVLPADGTFTALMSSEDFDSFLFLYSCSDDSCSTLAFFDTDDDSGGGVNGEDAEISLDLPEGTYLILATEFSSSEPDGDYVLTTTFDDGSATL